MTRFSLSLFLFARFLCYRLYAVSEGSARRSVRETGMTGWERVREWVGEWMRIDWDWGLSILAWWRRHWLR
jgi:hypothetical protein